MQNENFSQLNTSNSLLKIFKNVENIGKKGRTKSKNNSLSFENYNRMR